MKYYGCIMETNVIEEVALMWTNNSCTMHTNKRGYTYYPDT